MHILSWQKETETRGLRERSRDDIAEFGYGGALVRIKSDQEPAIVDIQRVVIAKRGSAPTIVLKSPVGDSQSNGTILSSLASRWASEWLVTTQSIFGFFLSGLFT